MYGIVPGVGKEARKDCVLGDYKIPKGTRVIIHMHSIHHSEDYYEKPYEFNPDRWETTQNENVDESEKKKNQYWM